MTNDPNHPGPPVNYVPPERARRWMIFWSGLACALACFLTGLHYYSKWYAQNADVPFCSWASWLDCTTVLSDPRWSVWMGASVSLLAVLLYVFGVLLPLGVMGHPACADKPACLRRVWQVLYASTLIIALSAIWFIGLQVFVIGKLCWFCLVGHGLGLVVVWSVRRRGRGVFEAMGPGLATARLAGMFLTGLLVGGQLASQPDYTHRLGAWELDEAGRYIETDRSGEGVEIAGGRVTLSRLLHPMIGAIDAEHVIVKVLDYTCPRCRNLDRQLSDARPLLGEDYAVLVINLPLSGGCNPQLDYTDERHRHACRLVELGKGVWRVDPAQYPAFHHWLFENQDGMTPERALSHAETLVGRDALRRHLEGDAIGAFVRRDVEIATLLGVSQLPGLFAGETVFDSVPTDHYELAHLLIEAFEPIPP